MDAITSVVISGLGSQALSGEVSVSPSATTTYTLTATGAGGSSVNASVTVTVAVSTSPNAGTYFGTFSGSTVFSDDATCRWDYTVTGSGTFIIAGAGTNQNPYRGSFDVTATGSGPTIEGPCSPLGPETFPVMGPVFGSSGTVEAHLLDDSGTRADFTSGTFSGNMLTGTLTIDVPGFEHPITTNFTLFKQ